MKGEFAGCGGVLSDVCVGRERIEGRVEGEGMCQEERGV